MDSAGVFQIVSGRPLFSGVQSFSLVVCFQRCGRYSMLLSTPSITLKSVSWLAKRIKKYIPCKGERLLGIIEITEEDKEANRSFSAQIFDAAQQKMVQKLIPLK